MSDDEPEFVTHRIVFRGDLDECLYHYGALIVGQAPRGSRGAVQARRPMADFCGVVTHTVCRWLYRRTSGSLPVGEPLFKLMCFLDCVGYAVIELERLALPARNFVDLIGFGLLSLKEAAIRLGYSTPAALSHVLQGRSGMSEEKKQHMWEMWKAKREVLDSRKTEIRARCRLDIPSGEVRTVVGGVELAAATASRPRVLTSLSTVIVKLIEGLLALLNGHTLSTDELAVLRASADTILELSVRLSALGAKCKVLDVREEGGGS